MKIGDRVMVVQDSKYFGLDGMVRGIYGPVAYSYFVLFDRGGGQYFTFRDLELRHLAIEPLPLPG